MSDNQLISFEDLPAEILSRFMVFMSYNNIMKIILGLSHFMEFTNLYLWRKRFEVYNYNFAFSCIHGDLFTFYWILSEYRGDDLYIKCNIGLELACKYNRDNLAKLFLQRIYYINSKFCSEIIIYGLSNNSTEIPLLILKDERFHPKARCLSNIIKVVVEKQHTDILEFILSQKRFKISRKNKSFILGCGLSNDKIVKLFLDDGRVDPTYGNYKALFIACKTGNLSVVRLLLDDNRINLNSNYLIGYYICNEACITNEKDIIDILIAKGIFTEQFIFKALSEKLYDEESFILILEYYYGILPRFNMLNELLTISAKQNYLNLAINLIDYGKISMDCKKHIISTLEMNNPYNKEIKIKLLEKLKL